MENCSTPDKGWHGDRSRGASMGRSNRQGEADIAERFHLRRVRLNSGGYDSGGAYWGHGGEMYEAFSPSGAFMVMRVWPADRSAAFAARGGARIGEPGHAEFAARYPRWAKTGSREAAKDMVREDYPHAQFYR